MFIGELIAITTVLCWTVSVQFFGAATREVGSTPVNIIRLTTAVLLFSVFLLIRDGEPLPLAFPVRAWWYLGLSGVVGFFIGDIFLFKALAVLGPRLAMLLHSLAAPTAAVIGWLFLGEVYRPMQWLGIGVTLFGVSMVILEKRQGKGELKASNVTLGGVLLGLGAMLGQAGGFVLSKMGMQHGDAYLDAFAATQIRAVAGCLCFFVFFTLTGRWRHVGSAIKNRKALAYTISGAFLGPFIGVSLSLLTLHYLATGVAATILSLVPVCIIPFAVLVHKEYVSFKAIAGAVIAVAGIALLMG